MYTQCPFCDTLFRVQEQQLERASGKVRCGQCQQVFNAREHLFETLPSAALTPSSPSTSESEAAPLPEPEFAAPIPASATATAETTAEVSPPDLDLAPETSIPGLPEDEVEDEVEFEWDSEDVEEITLEAPSETPARNSTPPSTPEPAAEEPATARAEEDIEIEPTISRAWDKAPGEDLSGAADLPAAADDGSGSTSAGLDQDATQARGETESESEIEIEAQQAPEPIPAPRHDDVPLALREALAVAEAPVRSPWLTAGGLMFMVVLALLLLAQFAYYYRSDLIVRFPQFAPVATRACARLGCDIPLPRNVERIMLISRDIRSHPRVSGALLITATMNNEAAFAQPCPIVQLSLFDLTGSLVAQRRFLPREYLDVAPAQGTTAMMQPDEPVRIRLEVQDPGQHAINYEFTFL